MTFIGPEVDTLQGLRGARSLIREHSISGNVERFREGLVSKAYTLVYHSTLGSRVLKEKKKNIRSNFDKCTRLLERERESFIDNLLAQIHFIV